MRAKHFSAFALAALLAAPALADSSGPPQKSGATALLPAVRPPNPNSGLGYPPDPGKGSGPGQIGGGSNLPAVQTPGMTGMTGMTGMDGMAGMGGDANLPAVQYPSGPPTFGGDANLLPAVQLPALLPVGGMPGGMGPAGFKH